MNTTITYEEQQLMSLYRLERNEKRLQSSYHP